ncbi:MAG: PQQ-binding-like beta-propeller repeat protein [Verrucomicrobiota bacterium]
MKVIRIGLLSLILISGPILWIYLLSLEMTMYVWYIAFTIPIWLLLLGLWYLCFGKSRFKTRLLRLGSGIGIAVLLGVLFGALFEYEGSSSGSSYPTYRWRWSAADEGASVAELRTSESAFDFSESEIGESLDFLGPQRDGLWTNAKFETDWVKTPPVELWRRPVGKSWSSFAVVEGKAITMEQAGDNERVTCLDALSGEEIWHYDEVGVRLMLEKEENAGIRMGGDGPRSTPVVHEGKVYSLGSTGFVTCIDLQSGSLVWKRNVIKEFEGEVQKWGSANSPLILAEEKTVVVPGTDLPGVNLVAFDLLSGETVWTFEGSGASYSSPRLVEIDGVPQILAIHQQEIAGHNPVTGQQLWAHEWRGPFPKSAQPLLIGDSDILACASYGVGSLLVRVSRDGNSWSTEQLWKSTRMKTKFSSPVVLGDFAYGLDEGRLACISLESGDRIWKNEKFGFGQNLLFGEHLLVQTEKGDVVIGQVDATGFNETGRVAALSSMTWNAPTVAGRLLLARNDREAVAYLLGE